MNGAATGSIGVARPGGPLNVRAAGTVSLASIGRKLALILADAPTPIRYPASLVGDWTQFDPTDGVNSSPFVHYSDAVL